MRQALDLMSTRVMRRPHLRPRAAPGRSGFRRRWHILFRRDGRWRRSRYVAFLTCFAFQVFPAAASPRAVASHHDAAPCLWNPASHLQAPVYCACITLFTGVHSCCHGGDHPKYHHAQRGARGDPGSRPDPCARTRDHPRTPISPSPSPIISGAVRCPEAAPLKRCHPHGANAAMR